MSVSPCSFFGNIGGGNVSSVLLESESGTSSAFSTDLPAAAVVVAAVVVAAVVVAAVVVAAVVVAAVIVTAIVAAVIAAAADAAAAIVVAANEATGFILFRCERGGVPDAFRLP
jgi:hypothetical protein